MGSTELGTLNAFRILFVMCFFFVFWLYAVVRNVPREKSCGIGRKKSRADCEKER